MSWAEVLDRAHIGPIPGWLALASGALFHAIWIGVAWYTWWEERHDKTKMADFLESRRDASRHHTPSPIETDTVHDED